MTENILPYATPPMRQPKPPLTPEQRRFRKRIARMMLVVLLLVVGLTYVLYIGDNRWRVRWHHGVNLPSSARQFQCGGQTAFPFILDGHSAARFVIDEPDLQSFLVQFQEGVQTGDPWTTGVTTTGKPWSQPQTPDGSAWGPSPTGRDYYGVKWHTTDKGVLIELDTDWN